MTAGHPFGGGHLPPDLAKRQAEEQAEAQRKRLAREQAERDRLQRCEWSQEVADGLLAGRMPSIEARLYFGGALARRLRGEVPDLEQALRLRPVQGSRITAKVLLARKPSSR